MASLPGGLNNSASVVRLLHDRVLRMDIDREKSASPDHHSPAPCAPPASPPVRRLAPVLNAQPSQDWVGPSTNGVRARMPANLASRLSRKALMELAAVPVWKPARGLPRIRWKLGANWIRPDRLRQKWRAVVGQ